MKCYRKLWNWNGSFVYYIHDDPRLERFVHKFILWSTEIPHWHRGILPWGSGLSLEDLEEISPLEILVMTGVGVEEAIETSR